MKPYLNGAKPMSHSVSSAGDQEQVNVADSLSVFHLVLQSVVPVFWKWV